MTVCYVGSGSWHFGGGLASPLQSQHWKECFRCQYLQFSASLYGPSSRFVHCCQVGLQEKSVVYEPEGDHHQW